MEETAVTSVQVLGLLRKNWLLILALAVAGVVAGAVVSWLQPTLYSATSTGYVVAGNSSTVGDAFAGQNLATDKADTYLPLVQSRSVAERVAKDLAIAVCGDSHPRIGDQRSPAGSPSARCWGSKIATGPMRRRARMVAVRLSGRVEVTTTAPGASRIAGITRCRPLPERGGPMTMIESSTDAHTPTPFEAPSR